MKSIFFEHIKREDVNPNKFQFSLKPIIDRQISNFSNPLLFELEAVERIILNTRYGYVKTEAKHQNIMCTIYSSTGLVEAIQPSNSTMIGENPANLKITSNPLIIKASKKLSLFRDLDSVKNAWFKHFSTEFGLICGREEVDNNVLCQSINNCDTKSVQILIDVAESIGLSLFIEPFEPIKKNDKIF